MVTAQQTSLPYYLNAAKQNSPALRDLRNQIAGLQLDSEILRASFGPQVNFISSNNYSPVVRGYGYDGAVTNTANVSGLFQVSRNYFARGNMAEQYRFISLAQAGLRDTITLSQQDISRAITDQYINAYADQLTSQFNREIFELMKQEDTVLKRLTQAGIYKQTDYLAFYVTMQQQELNYQQAIIQYNSDFLGLNYLAGIRDTTIREIQPPKISDSIVGDFYQSVFFTRFRTDSLRFSNEKALINFQYKPRLGAYADAGYLSSLQYLPYRNFGFSAGLSLLVPIYDGHQKQKRLASVNLRQQTSLYNRDFYVGQYQLQVQQLKQQISAIDMLVMQINKQIEYTRTLIIANGKLLQRGDIAVKDYITAINAYLVARNLLTQNNINRLRIANQIAYWNINP
jgi:outer membrane protein TolC